MDLLVALAAVLLAVLLLVALGGGPGMVIQWRRRRSIARTLAALEGEPAGPFLPIELDAADCYVKAVTDAAKTCLAGIDEALAAFAHAGREHYGPEYEQPDKLPGVKVRTHGVPGDMAKATRVALVRLRVGFHEPVSAYRPGNTPTGMHGMRGLWELLSAEEQPATA